MHKKIKKIQRKQDIKTENNTCETQVHTHNKRKLKKSKKLKKIKNLIAPRQQKHDILHSVVHTKYYTSALTNHLVLLQRST